MFADQHDGHFDPSRRSTQPRTNSTSNVKAAQVQASDRRTLAAAVADGACYRLKNDDSVDVAVADADAVSGLAGAGCAAGAGGGSSRLVRLEE